MFLLFSAAIIESALEMGILDASSLPIPKNELEETLAKVLNEEEISEEQADVIKNVSKTLY